MTSPSPSTSPTKTPSSRPPPPSLFLGPPSRNNSQASLPTLLSPPENVSRVTSNSPSPRPGLLRPRSSFAPLRRNLSSAPSEPSPLHRSRTPNDASSALTSDAQKQRERTDALWVEMQSTLEEVELSANKGAHTFGAEHAHALEELRTAQIALAQVWARSEADEMAGEVGKDGEAMGVVSGKGLLDGSDVEGAKKNRGGLEEETENDILLARKRREANDRYFMRINGGVLDVVGRLEGVANAMRRVGRESREIWGDVGESP